jgi:Transposase IS116/IS110/IS902 family
VPSIPGIGPTQAATILAMIGNIANFDRPAQLKAYCGWAPTLTQSGVTVDRARLTPRGARSLKRTLYLAVWHLVRHPDNEFARLYARLAPRKCVYDERTRQYRGKGKVIGRVAGQLITVMFTLLKHDQERLAHAKGGMAPAPELYDPELHRRHRAGQYQPPAFPTLGTVVQLPPQ